MNKNYRALFVVLVLCILGAIAYGVYMGFSAYTADVKASAKIVGPVFHPPVSTRPDRFLEYKSLLFGFTVFYPDDLHVLEYDDGSSASTITFEDARNEKGFQIFIVPYADDHITDAQLKKDLPSGVVVEPMNVVIDGVSAMMFFSVYNGVDMREVWFIRNGFLYEVSTYKELDAWLSQIMATWKFM